MWRARATVRAGGRRRGCPARMMTPMRAGRQARGCATPGAGCASGVPREGEAAEIVAVLEAEYAQVRSRDRVRDLAEVFTTAARSMRCSTSSRTRSPNWM